MSRFNRREGDKGFEVFDLWTGQTVVLKGVRQNTMGFDAALDLAQLLNLRAEAGFRDILQ